MKKLLFVLWLAVVLTACKNGGPAEQDKVMEVALVPPPPSSEPLIDKPAVDAIKFPAPVEDIAVDKKIIKEGDITFETGDLKNTHNRIIDTLKKLGGYVDEEREDNNAYAKRKNYTLNIRVPAQHFEGFLSAVSTKADRIESKSIRVKDVTTQYIDITTRLKNKQLLENRYKELLQKSAKMADILEIEGKLNEIRTDIESTQGELNYLNKQIAYSSLNITFFTPYASDKNDGSGFTYRFKTAISQSVELMQNIFFGLITSWPVVLIVVVLLFLFRMWRRKRKTANS